MTDVVTVFASADVVKFAIAKIRLDEEDIAYVVQGELMQDMIGFGRAGGFNIASGPARIQVASENVDRAREALEGIDD
jgi:hypothetical protein